MHSRRRALGDGLDDVLRLCAVFQIFKSVFLTIIAIVIDNRSFFIGLLPLLLSIGFLAYISSGVLRVELGDRYLAVTVMLATIDILVTKGAFLYWLAAQQPAGAGADVSYDTINMMRWWSRGVTELASVWHSLLQMSMLIGLLLLLLMISWQYRSRAAIAFTLLTTVADLVLNATFVPSDRFAIASAATIIAGRTFIFIIIGNLISHLVTIQDRQRRSLQEANAELAWHAATIEELTISRERNRMARELHDTTAHALTAAAVQIEAVDAQWRIDVDKSHAALMRAGEAVRGALAEMRRSLKALRAAPLEDLGFNLALRDLIEQVRQRSGAVVHFTVYGGFESLPSDLEHALYRVIQEALENVVRHSEAKRVDVVLQRGGGRGRLEIIDDGIGFDVVAVRSDAQRFGLRGIVERIEALGGRASIESTPGAGARIVIEWEETDDSHSAL